MSILNEITMMAEKKLLIAFADLSGFSKAVAQNTPTEIFAYMNEIYEMTGEAVESAGGVVINFYGDESLIVFPETSLDEGVIALLRLKETVDELNSSSGVDCRLIVRCHFGLTAIGLAGSSSDKRLGVMGNEINRCAMMKTDSFAVSYALFEKLKPETRAVVQNIRIPVSLISL